MKHINISEFIGKTFKDIEVSAWKIIFHEANGKKYKMFHQPDWNKDVYLEDICGNIKDLIGNPIIKATEDTNNDLSPVNDYDDSWTWTIYEIATTKGCIILKWYGSSSGYYSELVDIIEEEVE